MITSVYQSYINLPLTSELYSIDMQAMLYYPLVLSIEYNPVLEWDAVWIEPNYNMIDLLNEYKTLG